MQRAEAARDPHPHVTVEEAAGLLGVSAAAVRKRIARGTLEAHQAVVEGHRRWLVSTASLKSRGTVPRTSRGTVSCPPSGSGEEGTPDVPNNRPVGHVPSDGVSVVVLQARLAALGDVLLQERRHGLEVTRRLEEARQQLGAAEARAQLREERARELAAQLDREQQEARDRAQEAAHRLEEERAAAKAQLAEHQRQVEQERAERRAREDQARRDHAEEVERERAALAEAREEAARVAGRLEASSRTEAAAQKVADKLEERVRETDQQLEEARAEAQRIARALGAEEAKVKSLEAAAVPHRRWWQWGRS